jgi:hypothetical protein
MEVRGLMWNEDSQSIWSYYEADFYAVLKSMTAIFHRNQKMMVGSLMKEVNFG